MNKHQPKISVITVCRNCENSISSTINSILEQKYSHIEYLVVDGLSTDTTMAVALAFQQQFIDKGLEFDFTSEKDDGIYDAMNKGVLKSNGDYIIFMNSGDIFHDEFALQNCFRENLGVDTDIIFGDTLALNSKMVIKSPKNISKEFFFKETICHQSVLSSRKIFESIGLFNLNFKVIADREWLLKAQLAGFKFKYVPITISIWDEQGFSNDNISVYKREVKELKKKYFTIFEHFSSLLNGKITAIISLKKLFMDKYGTKKSRISKGLIIINFIIIQYI